MAPTATETVDLEQYNGKKVIVTVADGEDGSTEIEGKIDAANDVGILIKPKGSSQTDLIEAGKILQIVLVPEKSKGVQVKKVDLLTIGHARQHLADRHGIKVSELNKFDEEKAFAAHAQIDHGDLAHKHVDKKAEKEAADAAEAAKAAQAAQTPAAE